jgi:serpin B
MKTSLSLPLLSLTLTIAACDPVPAASSNSTSAAPAPTAPPATSPGPASTALAPVRIDAPAPLAKPATIDELKAMAKSDNAFAVDLYARARAQKGNLVMSPFSISTALAMTWAGAKGETAAQMARVLHLDGPADRAVDIAGSLVASYGAPDNKVTVRIANRLFGEKSYAFEQPFLGRLQTAFGAPLEPVDFTTATEPSRARINAWVAGQTQDRIKDLVPAGGVTKDTRLALVNAIYFLGDWAVPFEKSHTANEPFFTAKIDKKDVPTMHQTEHLHFAATDGVKVLELPYQNGALAMDFVLPDTVDGLDAIEARLTPAILDKWMGTAQTDQVIVSLPKFELAPQASLSLGETLSAMGMPLAFDRVKADFTGIANPRNPEDRLYISAVFHKGFIKVDEKGTEAAAASAVMTARAGAAAPVAPPKEFKADHPFLYLLRDTRSGLVLFMGRVSDPSSK